MLREMYVVDELMGVGKTSAVINMLRPGRRAWGKRYIYVTPYLDEVKRVKRECGFYEPGTYGTKTNGLRDLLRSRRCVVTTHALLSIIDTETIRLIEDGNYSLVMDEALVPIEEAAFTTDDFDVVKKSKLITIDDDGLLHWEKPKYKGDLARLKRSCSEGSLIGIPHKSFWDAPVMWQLPPKVLKAFDQVYILTYMFGGQLLKYYLDAYGFDYKYKYVRETEIGYELSDERSSHVRPKYGDLIHVIFDEELNSIGDSDTALSKSWYERGKNATDARVCLKKWIDMAGRGQPTRVMWTTYKSEQAAMIRGRSAPKKGFLSCNARATNKFAGRDILAYMINRYMNVGIKTHLQMRGVEIDEDEFALSEMLQWIFRSAVRNGEEIWIYIPSRRMRGLLLSWIKEVDGSATV